MALIKLAMVLFLVNASKSFEMYSDYSKTHVFHFLRWFDDCPGFNNIAKVNMTISGNKRNMVASVRYDLMNDFPNKFSLSLEIERCASEESPDTCVQLTPLNSDHACIMMRAKDQFYSTALNCLTPKFDCPVKKGVYNGEGCYFTMTKFKWFPIPTNYYYKVRYFGVNKMNNERFYCFLFAGKLERKRNVD